MPRIVHSSKRGVAVGATPTQTEQVSPARLKTILLVEDQEVCRITTKWFLANFGYAVVTARSAEEALALFVPEIHDVVVTDNNMAGLTGTERGNRPTARTVCLRAKFAAIWEITPVTVPPELVSRRQFKLWGFPRSAQPHRGEGELSEIQPSAGGIQEVDNSRPPSIGARSTTMVARTLACRARKWETDGKHAPRNCGRFSDFYL